MNGTNTNGEEPMIITASFRDTPLIFVACKTRSPRSLIPPSIVLDRGRLLLAASVAEACAKGDDEGCGKLNLRWVGGGWKTPIEVRRGGDV
jgi:hypothetical protein